MNLAYTDDVRLIRVAWVLVQAPSSPISLPRLLDGLLCNLHRGAGKTHPSLVLFSSCLDHCISRPETRWMNTDKDVLQAAEAGKLVTTEQDGALVHAAPPPAPASLAPDDYPTVVSLFTILFPSVAVRLDFHGDILAGVTLTSAEEDGRGSELRLPLSSRTLFDVCDYLRMKLNLDRARKETP